MASLEVWAGLSGVGMSRDEEAGFGNHHETNQEKKKQRCCLASFGRHIVVK